MVIATYEAMTIILCAKSIMPYQSEAKDRSESSPTHLLEGESGS